MPIEQYVNFNNISLSPEGVGYDYSLKGSDIGFTVELLPSGHGSSYFPRPIAPIGDPVAWQELLEAGEMDAPDVCGKCPPDNQAVLWRTFTDTALSEFRNSN